jgi:hypothetical protein
MGHFKSFLFRIKGTVSKYLRTNTDLLGSCQCYVFKFDDLFAVKVLNGQ